MGNPAEELYRRSAIGEGRKVIYVDINSCARTIRVGVGQWNATQRMPTSVATEAVCYVRIYARQVEISWTWRKERGCREVSNVPKEDEGRWFIT